MAGLGTLPGTTTSQALAVNDSGQVVGTSADVAFVYSNGTMTNLNSVIVVASKSQSPTLEQATAVNDLGQIVADAYYLGENIAVLLTPLLPGDANEDGQVDVNDLTVVLTNFGDTKRMSWTTGDFNGDGTVDINDLTIVLAHYNQSSGLSAGGVAAVPEPGTLAILFAAGLSGWWWGWTRRKR